MYKNKQILEFIGTAISCFDEIDQIMSANNCLHFLSSCCIAMHSIFQA